MTSELKKDRDEYREQAEKVGEIQKQLDEANTKLKEYEADEKWKDKYDRLDKKNKDLEKEFDDYKKEISNKETLAKKRDSYRDLLKEIGISEKRLESVMKVSDINSIEFDDDGKIKDSDTLKETLKNEWSDFVVKTGEQGAKVPTPPDGNGQGGNGKSRAMQLAQKYYADVYGTNTKGE